LELNFMPIESINTQRPQLEGGLLLSILRNAGQLAGKNKLRPEDPDSAGPMDPTAAPRYKEDWWDSLYGGQANRINAAGGIDAYNRASTLKDASTAQITGLKNTRDDIVPRNDQGIIANMRNLLAEKPREEAVASGAAGREKLQEFGNRLARGANEGLNLSQEQKIASARNAATGNKLPLIQQTMENQAESGAYKSTADLSRDAFSANPELLSIQNATTAANTQAGLADADIKNRLSSLHANAVNTPEYASTASLLPLTQARGALMNAQLGDAKVVPEGASILFPNMAATTTATFNPDGSKGAARAGVPMYLHPADVQEQLRRQGSPVNERKPIVAPTVQDPTEAAIQKLRMQYPGPGW
jgi:hypothetical protein